MQEEGNAMKFRERIGCALLSAVLLLDLVGCQEANSSMQQKQKPNLDPRGMRNEHHLEDRVNTNLPRGGSSPKDEYEMRQNIRPGDAAGGKPQSRQVPQFEEGGMKPSTVDPTTQGQ